MKEHDLSYRLLRAVFVAFVIYSLAVAVAVYRFYICREYSRWYFHIPDRYAWRLFVILFVGSVLFWRRSRVLSVLGIVVSLVGFFVECVPVL